MGGAITVRYHSNINGWKNLADIVQELLRRGRSHLTPIAIIRWAGTPSQQIWTGQLGNILEQTVGLSLSPAVIVIGEVVGLRNYLQPEKISSENSTSTMSNNQYFTGKTILVTRSSGQSSQFSDRLTTLGATVIEMPTLEIRPPSSWQELDQRSLIYQTSTG